MNLDGRKKSGRSGDASFRPHRSSFFSDFLLSSDSLSLSLSLSSDSAQ